MPPRLSTWLLSIGLWVVNSAQFQSFATRALELLLGRFTSFIQPSSCEDFMKDKHVFELVFVKGSTVVGTSLRVWDVKSLLLVDTIRRSRAFGLWSRRAYKLRLVSRGTDVPESAEMRYDSLRDNRSYSTSVGGENLLNVYVYQKREWGFSMGLFLLLNNANTL